MLLWHSSARAWGYNEHYELGQVAYRTACLELGRYAAESANPRLAEPMRARYELACGTGLVDPARRREGQPATEPGHSLLSAQYGQFVALSGDHLTIENIRGLAANIAARNVIEYLALASHNADHFHPLNVELWRQYHTEALLNAVKAAEKDIHLEQLHEFWLGFYHSAYADHFLQDAFAAGHSGFNRPSSTPTASYRFHKDLNQSGKLLRDSAGRQWRTYGDDNLAHPMNVHGKSRVQQAATSSVRAFLVAFITGKPVNALEDDVLRRIPIWANQKCTGQQDAWYGARSNPYNDAIDAEDQAILGNALEAALGVGQAKAVKRVAKSAAIADCRLDHEVKDDKADRGWHSLLHIHEAAKYAVTHTFSISHFGRIEPFDAVWAPTYSFGIYLGGPRLGLDLGWFRSFRDEGNDGFLIGPAASYPLGGKYGTVLSWDLDVKMPLLFPAANTGGTEFVQHFMPSVGLGMSAEFGLVNLRLSAGPAAAYSNRLGPGPDRWGWNFGWYGQAGLHFIFAPRGGGPMRPWAF